MLVALVLSSLLLSPGILSEDLTERAKPSPAPPGLPGLPALPSLPPLPPVPAAVPQFLDSFSSGLSKVSAALRGPNPLASLAPMLMQRFGQKPSPAAAVADSQERSKRSLVYKS